MPLTLTELEFALDKQLEKDVRQIFEVLSLSPELAFTATEIAARLGLVIQETQAILEKLDDLDFVRSGRVDGILHYQFKRSLPTTR